MVNPKSLLNLRHDNKRGKSVYTVADLLKHIKNIEQSVKKATGKDFNYLESLIKRSLQSDMLAKAMLDRIVPEEKKPIDLNLKTEQSYNINLSDYGITNDYIKQYARDLLNKRRQQVGATT